MFWVFLLGIKYCNALNMYTAIKSYLDLAGMVQIPGQFSKTYDKTHTSKFIYQTSVWVEGKGCDQVVKSWLRTQKIIRLLPSQITGLIRRRHGPPVWKPLGLNAQKMFRTFFAPVPMHSHPFFVSDKSSEHVEIWQNPQICLSHCFSVCHLCVCPSLPLWMHATNT